MASIQFYGTSLKVIPTSLLGPQKQPQRTKISKVSQGSIPQTSLGTVYSTHCVINSPPQQKILYETLLWGYGVRTLRIYWDTQRVYWKYTEVYWETSLRFWEYTETTFTILSGNNVQNNYTCICTYVCTSTVRKSP